MVLLVLLEMEVAMVMGTGEELGTELVDKVGEFAQDTHHKVL